MKLSKLLSSKRILVIGDAILDHYIYGKVYRVSPEAPVPIVLKKKSSYFLGGAANVAQNIVAFGSECSLLSVTGRDEAKEKLEILCGERKIKCFLFEDESRPTTIKTRVIGNDCQIARIDEEVTEDINHEIQNKILDLFEEIVGDYDAIILQDYGKGLLTVKLVRQIIAISKHNNKKIIVDPKNPDIIRYTNCSLLKPNLQELKNIAGLPQHLELSIDEIVKISRNKIVELGIESFLITLSERGMVYVDRDQSFYEPGIKIEVSDVSGAGDTVSAVISLCVSANVEVKDWIKLANASGSLVCKISGAAQISPESLYAFVSINNPLINLVDGTPVIV